MSRKTTKQILEMVKEGVLDRDTLIIACLKYMSEADVEDMSYSEGFLDIDTDCDHEMQCDAPYCKHCGQTME